MDAMHEWLQTHLPETALGLLAGIFGFIKWLVGREIKRTDDQMADHEDRLRRLEESRVTRTDFDELRVSLMASIVNIGERLERQSRDMHTENRETMERIHERVDALWERRLESRDR